MTSSELPQPGRRGAAALHLRTDAGIEHVVAPGRSATIGRASTCEVHIDLGEVSGRHARLYEEDGSWIVEDLGSRNGTYVGTERIGRHTIRDGMVLHLVWPQRGPRVECSLRTWVAQPPPPPPAPSSSPAAVDGTPRAIAGPEAAGPRTVFRGGGRHAASGPAGEPIAVRVLGRDPDCDLHATDDLLVSGRHASVAIHPDGTAVVRDLGSTNGTFVDGDRADPELVARAGQRVTVGNTVFRFDGRELHLVDLRGDVVFAVERLGVGQGTARRLDDVSFWLSERSLLAVLGSSGAGKSTLLKAITGMEPASEGRVLYDGRDLYRHFAELRQRIGYVPQDDILHPQLTVQRTLSDAAKLRFPADVSAAERAQRVDEVLNELGLQARRNHRVSQLSGGQRKRLSVGLELLSRPSLLILDEPTSGLDPGNERILMGLLRQLADGGRTIIVVTHTTASLHLCDRVLFLAAGGVTAFFGPPMALPDHVGVRDYPEAFAHIAAQPDAGELRRRYLASPHAAAMAGTGRTDRYGPPPVGSPSPGPPPVAAPTAKVDPPNSLLRQTMLFSARYVRLLAGDRRALVVLAVQAPLIALLMLAVFGSDQLREPGLGGRPDAGNVLMALVLAAIYTGASNSVREIVKERAVLRREQNFGVSALAYLCSKLLVLGAVTIVQSIVLVVIGLARQGGPTDPLVLPSAKLELIVAVSLCGISAMALGLLISAMVSSADKAMTVLPIVLFAQFLLAGLVFPVDRPGLEQASWLTSSRWGLAAAAATADYPALRGCDPGGDEYSTAPPCPASWEHRPVTWVGDVMAMLVLTAALGALTWLVLARGDPAAVLMRRRGGG